jgi:hypothetical protein
MPDSMVVVMATALPYLSTMDRCVVPRPSAALLPMAGVPNSPAVAVPMLRVVEISAARPRR